VRVVIAHCASLGQDRDLDRGPNGPYVESFSLFTRLFENPAYEKQLFGDISAMTRSTAPGRRLSASSKTKAGTRGC
jgi:mannonate dehydratase